MSAIKVHSMITLNLKFHTEKYITARFLKFHPDKAHRVQFFKLIYIEQAQGHHMIGFRDYPYRIQ